MRSHSGGEVQAVHNVPHQEDGAQRSKDTPVKTNGHNEGDEEHVHQLSQLVRHLQWHIHETVWGGGERTKATTRAAQQVDGTVVNTQHYSGVLASLSRSCRGRNSRSWTLDLSDVCNVGGAYAGILRHAFPRQTGMGR